MGDHSACQTPALIEEYKQLNENMRFYGNMRFAQLTLLNATTAALFFAAFRYAELSPPLRVVVKAGGVLASVVFLVMERRATAYWQQFRSRARCVEKLLGLEQHQSINRRGFGSSQAVLLLILAILAFWVGSLISPVFLDASPVGVPAPGGIRKEGGPVLWAWPPADLPSFWLSALVGFAILGALVATVLYARYCANALAVQERPILVIGRSGTSVHIENIGTGPALSTQVADHDGHPLQSVGTLPVGVRSVPLGAAELLAPDGGLHRSLFYQDLSGRWHETRFVGDGSRFKCRVAGRRAGVPPEIEANAAVESVYEQFSPPMK